MKRFSKSTDVQTLLFPMGRFTPSSARAWAERHGFRAYKVDIGGPRSTKIRVRQHPPESYRPGTFRTIPFSHAEGIEAVVGVPKEKRNPSKSAMLCHHLQDVMEATRAGRPDVARYLYREAGAYLPKGKRRNPMTDAEENRDIKKILTQKLPGWKLSVKGKWNHISVYAERVQPYAVSAENAAIELRRCGFITANVLDRATVSAGGFRKSVRPVMGLPS